MQPLKPIQEYYDVCPCCKSNDLDCPHENRMYQVSCFDTDIIYVYKVCNNCSHYFVSNPLSTISLNYYYKNSAQLRRDTVTDIEKEVFNKQINFIAKNAIIENNNILEIGCDTGQFLTELSNNGANTFHIEISDRALDFLSKGNHTLYNSNKKNINTIVARHVLEHTSEPVNFLKEIAGYLIENGIIFIEVPDLTDTGPRTDSLIFEHTQYFSTTSICALLDKSGLRPIAIEYDFTDNYGTTPNRVIRVLAKKKFTPHLKHKDALKLHYDNTIKKLYKYIENRIEKNSIALYSASWITQDILLNSEKIKSHVDNIYDGDPKKQGKNFMGITVGKPEYCILDNPDIIIITSSYSKEIKEELIRHGYKGEIISHTDIMK